jgi:hypothetical protein
MGILRRRPATDTIKPAPIPVPRFSIDGWTLTGVPLAARLASELSRPDLRELETLLHGIAIEVDTPYTYERAAVLLERGGEPGSALSVCEAWLALGAASWPEYTHHTRAVDKRRQRLRARLGTPPTTATAAT